MLAGCHSFLTWQAAAKFTSVECQAIILGSCLESETMSGANKWPGNGDQKLSIAIICLPILLGVFPPVISQLWNPGCILNLGNSSSMDKSSGCVDDDDDDDGGGSEWGGFLDSGKCCGVVFQSYLYGLGMRANETGQIFLSSAELRNCLIRINSSDVDTIFTCETEKLTTDRGGCSNFSVDDVRYKFGSSIRKFTKQCDFSIEPDRWKQSCDSCILTWKEMKGTQFEGSDQFIEADSDLCRFSLLVTSISARINDEEWVGKLFSCLGSQRFDQGHGAEENAENFKRKIGLSIIIGGAIVGSSTVLALFLWIFFRINSSSGSLMKKTELNMLKESKHLKIPVKEVYSATNNLHPVNCIGEGTAGMVYKGLLSDNRQAAIKHLINGGESFLREVRSLSHVRHPNLVSLLGYCKKGGECFLVYELCPNGNLSQWLSGQEDKILSWIQRIKIAIDSASGLCFLHSYPKGCIVHRDIKPTNILLGANLEAKLSDFGLSKVIELGETTSSSEVRGTFGYVDPEYRANHRVNPASDVYSFGIVLLQLLSGRKVIDMDTRKPQQLDKTAKSLDRQGKKFDFIDPRLEGEYSAKGFELIFELALSCTLPRQQLRPTMDQVVADLEEALHLSTMARASSPVATTHDLSTT